MKLNVLIYIALIGLIASCDSLRQEVEPKGLTQQSEKLVVSCFISPQDTVLTVLLSRSSPVLGPSNEFAYVYGATVTLSDGVKTVTLRDSTPKIGFGGSKLFYRIRASELPIVAGKTYTLKASAFGVSEVTATCTVPVPVALEQVLIDSALNTDFSDGRKNYSVRLRWRDAAGQANFYRIAGNNEYPQRFTFRPSPNAPPRDTLVLYTSSWYFDNGYLLTDLGRDGQEMISERARLASTSTFNNGVWTYTAPSGKLEAYLLNVDENYYRYHDAIERQNQVRDNPFAEPVLISSNIQGGFGCFGAYNRSTLMMRLK
ncbi:DUF4249 domain-containing protein [Spirosoma sp. BT702]|uniref:DUF4249 domain-containing protein n=1 Tax=Spirosoma profusum TaxID=2771354 RepID=A0A927AMG0_9BACT|nr:DUF4249 domain-containing protein [Spirosoma profusum]MBD2699719.1 DUF4249 domain-containing protein [Spirosoma profusum]